MPTIIQRGPSFYVQAYQHGRRTVKRFLTLRDAEAWAAEFQARKGLASVWSPDFNAKGPLLSAEAIIQRSEPVAPQTGIYFLIDGQEIVYVGMSSNVNSRLGRHWRLREKRFTHTFVLPCPREHLRDVEERYIRALSPKYNVRLSEGDNQNSPSPAGNVGLVRVEIPASGTI